MDVGNIVRRLRAAGGDAQIAQAGLLLDGEPVHVVTLGRRPATPSDLQRIADARRARSDRPVRPVVYAPRASAGAIAWLESHPEVTLVLDDLVVLDGVAHRLDDGPPESPRRKGPQPYARFAVARALLAGAPRRDQVRLAELAGVTQGSVSNALRRIPEIWDPRTAFDDLVRDYPGPGGQAYYWWSSSPVHEQARQLGKRGALISGDFAADRIAPWRMPERVVAYVDSPVDLSGAGYVLTEPGDYTTLVIAPADKTLRATAETWGSTEVADPLITAFDVLRTATTGDEDEAIDKLRDVVIKRSSDSQHG